MVSKVMGLDQVIESILTRLGDLEKAYLSMITQKERTRESSTLFLLDNIDQYHLNDLSRKTERYIKRKIRTLVLTKEEFEVFEPSLQSRSKILVWHSNDKTNMAVSVKNSNTNS
jgi:hypothetical protein